MEQWKKIIGFEAYQISSHGRIKRGEKILKGLNNPAGYRYVSLHVKGYAKVFAIHRLVAQHFIENPEQKAMVNHKDGVKNNNNVKNLEWVTRHENAQHSYHVLGTPIPPNWAKGKFGKDHNKSIGFDVVFPDGIVKRFGSGREFKRETGLDNTSISWARRNKELPYTFKKKSPLQGIKVLN